MEQKIKINKDGFKYIGNISDNTDKFYCKICKLYKKTVITDAKFGMIFCIDCLTDRPSEVKYMSDKLALNNDITELTKELDRLCKRSVGLQRFGSDNPKAVWEHIKMISETKLIK